VAGNSSVLNQPSQTEAAMTTGRSRSAFFARVIEDPMACISRIGFDPMPGP
jgi:hypothetical protein